MIAADADASSARASLSWQGTINMAISLLVAGLTYLSLALIARQFGGGDGSDAYFFLVSLTTVSTALLGGVFSAVLLPQLVEARVRGGLAQASELASLILGWTLLLCLLLGLAVWLGHDAFFGVATRFDATKLQAQKGILVWLGPLFFFSVLGEYFRMLLLGNGRFFSAGVSGLLSPILLIAVLLTGEELREESLAIAQGVSRILVVVFTVVMARRAGMILHPRLSGNAAGARFVRESAPYAAAGMVTNFAIFFFDYMATGLGAGVLTSVTYAQRVYVLPLALVVTPLLEVARVRLSEYRAVGDMAAFQRQYTKLATLVIYLTLPLGAVLFAFAQDIIVLLYQRGSFLQRDVEIAAACLQVLAWSVPLSCFFTLNGRVIELFGRLSLPALLGTAGNIGLILLTFQLVERVNFIGIAYARLAMDALYFLPLGLVLLRARGVHAGGAPLLRVLAVAAFACALPAFSYELFAHHLPLHIWGQWWTPAAEVGLWMLMYGVLLLAGDVQFRLFIIERLYKRFFS